MSEDLDKREQFIDRVLSILDKPYIKSLDNMGIDDIDTQELILSKLYNDNISIEYGDHYVDIYNSNGNLIYFENSDGKWDKWEFDSNGNEIYHENSDGFWEKWEYDSNGNLIYYEGSSGGWYKREYDSNNNLIYYEHSSGFWYKEEYDSNGDKIYYEDSDGYWDKYEYDSNGDLIYYENSNGDILDKRNNINESQDKKEQFIDRVLSILELPYFKSLNSIGIDDRDTQKLILSRLFNDNIFIEYGDHYVDIYNSNGKEIYYENSHGHWAKREYDSNGDQIYYENSNGEWSKREYDSGGNQIYYEDSNGKIIDNRNNNNINESEDKRDIFVNKVLSILDTPYIKSLNSMGIDDIDTQKVILSRLFNDNIFIEYGDHYVNTYNSNGKEIYYEHSNGFWSIREYDSNGNEIYYEISDGEWYKREYDSNGNEIYYENSEGDWIKREYDTYGNKIYYEDSEGNWNIREYDTNGKEIYFEDSNGFWKKTEYDSNGNLIYLETSYGYIIDKRNNINESEDKRDVFVNKVLSILDTPYFMSLDSIGIDDEDIQKLIFSRLFNDNVTIEYGDHYVDIYNSNGKVIYYEDSRGKWVKTEYDSQGNKIYYENYKGEWSKAEYDSDGNEIYYENSDGDWYKYEYDSQGNKIYYENSYGKIIDRRNKPEI